MPLNFSTTDKEAASHGVKCLVFGEAGTGKTHLCGTAPSPLIISAEAGLLTLRHKKIPVISVNEIGQVREALNWCMRDAKTHGIETICLDSISEITEKCLADEKARSKDPRQAYGAMSEEIVELVKKFRDLSGFHIIMTAKATSVKDPISGLEKAAPTAPGKQVGPALPYLFDEVFYSYSDKDQNGKRYWALRTQASFNVVAKDRSGVLDEIEYPDLTNIVHKIHAQET